MSLLYVCQKCMSAKYYSVVRQDPRATGATAGEGRRGGGEQGGPVTRTSQWSRGTGALTLE